MENAILIYQERGQVKHRFCPEQEARDYLVGAAERMESASMMAAKGVPADYAYEVSPDLRGHVADAKARLKRQIAVNEALDRHGVPRERELRIAIFRAMDEICFIRK